MKTIKDECQNLHLAVAYGSNGAGDTYLNLYSFVSNNPKTGIALVAADIEIDFKGMKKGESKNSIIVEALKKRFPLALSHEFIPD